jgi:hypothetical protein
MLYSKLFKEVYRLRDEVSIKFIEVVVEESREVFWNVSVILDFGFFFDGSCKVSVVTV